MIYRRLQFYFNSFFAYILLIQIKSNRPNECTGMRTDLYVSQLFVIIPQSTVHICEATVSDNFDLLPISQRGDNRFKHITLGLGFESSCVK